MKDIVSLNTGKTYGEKNWRHKYIGEVGQCLIVQPVDSTNEEQKQITFVSDDISFNVLYTSIGTIEQDGNRLTLTTKHSMYVFEITGQNH